jgi:ribosomal protein L37E
MANTNDAPRCAGCGRHPVHPQRVLCPACNALMACTEPVRWAAPTRNIAAALTLRTPAYVQAVA